MKSGSSSNPVFGSDFWKEEMNTLADPCLGEGGFVKGSSDPVVGKSGGRSSDDRSKRLMAGVVMIDGRGGGGGGRNARGVAKDWVWVGA
ncbi:hypothetical protein RHGRI_038832 [Rhododendron griersonianum]|uniref:Uncharacterized protein n=1 Tax=Rhododendron griersonianum TaxID=479676 RepID=A0AAV6HIH4_9ERIC|nr:hypothetical protein RHGRI_038832 [Rhododendron griersonianum]